MTPIKEINAAAKLMLKRAGAAHAGPYAMRDGCGGLDSVVAVLAGNHSAEFTADAWAVDVAYAEKPDARHLAGWTPELATAVAAWLSSFEDRMGELDFAAPDWNAALTIARAYLNGEK
jgi:hypothetical protein